MKKCNNCNEEVTTCDGGYGHKLRIGELIICMKRKMPQGSLHFCNEDEFKDYLYENKIMRVGRDSEIVKGTRNKK